MMVSVMRARSARREAARRAIPLMLAGALAAPLAATAQGPRAVPEAALTVRSFAVRGDNPLGAAATAAVLAPFVGERVDIDRLEAAAQALEAAIRARGFAFHRVSVPPQTPADGVVALAVVRFVLGEVGITGNRHFDAANVRASLPALVPGAAVQAQAVARQIAIANENPSKRTSLTMRAGARADTVDAEIKVEDSDPQQVYVALNNTGRRETGMLRATAVYQHNNLFGRDHGLTASFTTSPDHLDDVRQYGVNYVVPLYALGGSVAAFYTRSDVNSGRIADFFDVRGRGEFAGLRYTHTLFKVGAYAHKLTAGIESHHFRNDVTTSLAPGQPLGTDVGSRPLSLRYQGSWDVTAGSAGFFVEYLRNLDGGSGNAQAAYSANRAGASRSWESWRFGVDASRVLSRDWMLAARLRGQAAPRELIPGEQFGLGGVASVRGFRERETAGDSGYALSLELWAPSVAGGVRPFVFVDAGARRLRNPPPGQAGFDALSSVGVGMRWQWQKRLEVSLDLAGVVNGAAGGTTRGSSRLHFGVVYRF
ncbi:MAG: ShlB/FhaC/HecB family hemolysin secretion/activation protein [Burkholderiales bacterium]|nr:ShlB/FhaC/HecB family hemolysin secretion/activation protein [Burkholderiales bacterium]